MWIAEDANSLKKLWPHVQPLCLPINGNLIRWKCAHTHTHAAAPSLGTFSNFISAPLLFFFVHFFSANVQLAQALWWLNWTIASKGHMQVPYNGKCTGNVSVLGRQQQRQQAFLEPMLFLSRSVTATK